MSMTPYEELIGLVKDAGILGTIHELLDWDQETMMPKGQASLRAEQAGTLAKIAHQKAISPRIDELIKQLAVSQLTAEQAAQKREIVFDYERAIKVPDQLAHELALTASQASEIWQQARKNDDFSSFSPVLSRTIELKKEYARAIDASRPAYQVLFEDYEPGLSLEQTSQLLSQVKESVVVLIKVIAKKEPPEVLDISPSADVQHSFCHQLARSIGFDFSKGRLDTSAHPFTGAGRITTRFDHWLFAIASTIHEAGHGMYEHNLPFDHVGTPLGQPASFSVHESQSRFWENHIGKSREFWTFMLPKLNQSFEQQFDIDSFYTMINKVEMGCIRVDADELTYPLHIVLRFELEQAIFAGELRAEDLPVAWNEKMQSLLGIAPPSDSFGVLQDVHWSQGYFGYFPTYLLGSMMSAQLSAAMHKHIEHMDEKIARGDFSEIHDWLKENIHRHGRRYHINDLLIKATGKPLCADDYIEYLTKKYTALYGL